MSACIQSASRKHVDMGSYTTSFDWVTVLDVPSHVSTRPQPSRATYTHCKLTLQQLNSPWTWQEDLMFAWRENRGHKSNDKVEVQLNANRCTSTPSTRTPTLVTLLLFVGDEMAVHLCLSVCCVLVFTSLYINRNSHSWWVRAVFGYLLLYCRYI